MSLDLTFLVEADMTLLATEGFPLRTSCHVCGKRRKCNLLGFFMGPAWHVCREDADWRPVEGVDYEVGP